MTNLIQTSLFTSKETSEAEPRKMLRAMYDLHLQQMIRPGKCAVGEFTEGDMYLAAANMANKVVISKLPSGSTYASRIVPTRGNLQILNINQTITALAVGRFSTTAKTDYLFIGTPSEIIVYDVPENREIYRKVATGGVSSIAVGKTGRIKKTMAVVGGQSALQGFDEDGNEPLWTLTGDNVGVLILFDVNRDGQIEVIAGCDDQQIRIFRETEQIYSMAETDKVVSLAPLKNKSFVYGLANGTVGVYEQYERKWRIKSKSKPLALCGFDVNGNGEPEILCGWSTGKFEVRDRFNGNLLFKYQMDDPVAQIMEVTELDSGSSYILVSSIEGNVKAFAVEDGTSTQYTVTFLQDEVTPKGEAATPEEIPLDGLTIEDDRLRANDSVVSPETNLDYDPTNGWSTMPAEVEVSIEIEPILGKREHNKNWNEKPISNTSVLRQTYMRNDDGPETGPSNQDLFEQSCLKFTIRTSDPSYVIPGVVIFAEGVFAGESYYHHPPERLLSNITEFPIGIPKNIPVDMFITVMAGQENRKFYYCHGEVVRMKRFSMYYNMAFAPPDPPNGFVTFKINERINRFYLWASENFFLKVDAKSAGDQNGIVLSFICLRDGSPLLLKMEADGEITIMTQCIDTAGDIVESMAEGMTIKSLSSRGHFPKTFNVLKDIFVQIDDFQKNRQRQATDIADRASSIRAMLMKAEEAKMLEIWPEVKKYYMELRNQNKSVLADFNIQIDAQEKFTSALKSVSQTIDKAARLRVGPPKLELFTSCRAAVQKRDVQLLIKLMEFGAML